MSDSMGGIYAAIREARRDISKEVYDLRERVRTLERWQYALIGLLLIQGTFDVPWVSVLSVIK